MPDQIKKARVRPIFKGGDDEYLTNYRPVSILPVFGKVFEVCVNKRRGQYGFRRSSDTEAAAIDFVSDIQLRLDPGNLCALMSLDLRKAFDTVDHAILLNKFNNLGIWGLPWE